MQKQFHKKIIGSFHGLWSTGGIVGVGITTFMIALRIPITTHLALMSGLSLLIGLLFQQYLLRHDRSPSRTGLALGKPDPFILYLGLLIFFAAVCEGGMFDWSGIYFQQVIKEEVFTLGYFVFMTFMALSRFISDWLLDKIGMATGYVLSALCIISGITLAIVFPSFLPAMIGFSLVGFGTASIIPMTYVLAGSSKKYSPGIVVSILATFGIVGMLLGPPLIGYLAHAFNLKISFIAFALSGLMLIPISRMFFRLEKFGS